MNAPFWKSAATTPIDKVIAEYVNASAARSSHLASDAEQIRKWREADERNGQPWSDE